MHRSLALLEEMKTQSDEVRRRLKLGDYRKVQTITLVLKCV